MWLACFLHKATFVFEDFFLLIVKKVNFGIELFIQLNANHVYSIKNLCFN